MVAGGTNVLLLIVLVMVDAVVEIYVEEVTVFPGKEMDG